MPIAEIQASQVSRQAAPREGPRGTGPEEAAKNRELIKTTKTINEGGAIGPSSELRFAFDKATGQALIKIVDRVTNEVIAQVPGEGALRAAQILRELNPGDRIA
jgi:uncharacterized FlaG/YvyC family protein